MGRLKLRARIIEKYGTIGAFTQDIGITRGTASNVLAGKSTPTRRMLPVWCAALDIKPEETGFYFTFEPLKTEE